MKKLPPFLPGLSTKLQGRRRRRQLEILAQRRGEAVDASMAELAALFHDILPAEWLASIASDLRESVFTQVVVFWAWLSQVFEQNESCAKALARVEGWREAKGESRPAFDTSAYCKARGRLPDGKRETGSGNDFRIQKRGQDGVTFQDHPPRPGVTV